MDVSSLIKARLQELGFEQKELAAAAEVTESYVSQLLTRKKLSPAPDRTDIYEKMGKFLRLPNGELAKLARAQRMEKLKRGFEEAPAPLLKDVRELILRKFGRFSRGSPSASSSGSLHKSSWMSSVRSLERSWTIDSGSTRSHSSATKAMNRCESQYWSSSTRISSMFQAKPVFHS
jgi:transcriptional regulator with XRE-family HTH domain